jgi:Alpha/beta hydrolase family
VSGHVTSRDGTAISYDRAGNGPAVVLVGGGLDDGTENAPLAAELANRFTVLNYARRGRGESGDTPPYAIDREIEDLEALIAEAGGSAHVYGASSGGALALRAAAAGLAIDAIAVYEVPWNGADDWAPRWRRYAEDVAAAIADGRPGDALELFLQVTETPDEHIAGMRGSPYWPAMEALAHTLPYDAACLGDGRPPTAVLTRIAQPVLVATGGPHPPDAATWVRALDPAADAMAKSIPNAERQILEGQSHVPDPTALALILERFFAR